MFLSGSRLSILCKAIIVLLAWCSPALGASLRDAESDFSWMPGPEELTPETRALLEEVHSILDYGYQSAGCAAALVRLEQMPSPARIACLQFSPDAVGTNPSLAIPVIGAEEWARREPRPTGAPAIAFDGGLVLLVPVDPMIITANSTLIATDERGDPWLFHQKREEGTIQVEDSAATTTLTIETGNGIEELSDRKIGERGIEQSIPSTGDVCQICGERAIGFCHIRSIYVCNTHRYFTDESGTHWKCP